MEVSDYGYIVRAAANFRSPEFTRTTRPAWVIDTDALTAERDEARAEVDRLRAQVDELQHGVNHPFGGIDGCDRCAALATGAES